jgi:hypothetical protein
MSIGQAGVYWPLKTLLQGSGITIQESPTTITIGATGGGTGPGGGDMLSSQYATNGVYGIVDKAVIAEGLTSGAVVPQAVLAQQVPWTGITGIPTGFAPSPHAATHLPGGSDTIAPAGTVAGGLLNQLSGSTGDFVDGTNACQSLSPAVQPTIWAVRLRSFNAAGNPNFEVNQFPVTNTPFIVPAAGLTRICDRWFISRTNGINAAVACGRTGQASPTPGPANIPGINYRISTGMISLTLNSQQSLAVGAGDLFAITSQIEAPLFREMSADVHSFSILAFTNVVGGLRFGLSIRDGGVTQSLPLLCTIPTPEVWTLIQLPNLPKFPSAGSYGSFAPGVLAYSLILTLCSGSTWIAPSAGVWQSGNFITAPGLDNFLTKPVGAQLFIAFVQHEPGNACSTPMDLSFNDNLFACKRYYQKSIPYGYQAITGNYNLAVAKGQCVQGSSAIRSNVCFERELATANPVARIWYGTTQNEVYVDAVGLVGTTAPTGYPKTIGDLSGPGVTFPLSTPVLFDYDVDTGF